MAPPVVIVGAGPTGVLAAILLARRGVRCVVLERHTDVYALPRAVHLDDEVYRILQAAGVADVFAAVTRPALGLRLVDTRGRVLAEFARSAGVGPHGYPQANMFDQPDLEAMLRAEAARLPGVELRGGAEVVWVTGGDRPRVSYTDLATGTRTELAAVAVLGCDGASSPTRRAIGSPWRDLGFRERWLVVDARCRPPLDAWDGVHQVCDPSGAATFMRIGADRYRWEFRSPSAPLRELLRPWTGDREVEVLREAPYTFEAGVAGSWRCGRVFLLGDAAHLTPPFVGQGLGAGLRDAANLAWKLARVLRGEAPEALLDTYQPEREAHVRAMIRLAMTAGWAMTGGQGRGAAVRRLALRGLCRLPGVATRVLDTGSPPLPRGPLVVGRGLAGTLVPQPRVRGQRLDDVLSGGFAVLTRVAPDPALVSLAVRLDAPVLDVREAEDDGVLRRWLGRATAVVLRPDRTVLVASRSPAPGAGLAAGAWVRLVAS
ncbi:MAG TPA: bifunctional 3-(3-hydroxy-phenyl)propionate/3-hydroxycinnamic acid hydroxylase [Mycobacteriales bacterium]